MTSPQLPWWPDGDGEPGSTDDGPDQAGDENDDDGGGDDPEDLAPPGHPTRAADVLPLIDKEIA